MKKFIMFAMGTILMTSSLVGCSSEEKPYPNKAVQVVIPYGPGGGSDILTRAIMKYIQLPNEQPLVAINVEGAAGYTGAQQVINAENDGYTILAHNQMDVASYSLGGTTSRELWSELEMICNVVDDFNVISTNPASGFTSINEVVTYAKANPGEIKWGVTGSKNVNYGDTLRLAQALGIEDVVTIVPYDGGAASKTALMGNHIQMETNSASDIRTSVESGDAIPLMVIGDRRANSLPDVPSSVELGYDIVTTKPRGYYAPPGTDPAIIEILSNAIKEVTEIPEFVETVEGLGLEVNYMTGEETQVKIEEWVETLKPVFAEMLGE